MSKNKLLIALTAGLFAATGARGADLVGQFVERDGRADRRRRAGRLATGTTSKPSRSRTKRVTYGSEGKKTPDETTEERRRRHTENGQSK